MPVENSQFDCSSPLYLHPSDHPGMTLVAKVFDGCGFGSWKKAMSIALSAKNKIGFVTGLVAKPPSTDATLPQWQRCNDMVTSWILNTLANDIAESVIYCDSASQIWNELEERFGLASGARLYQLQKDLCENGQGSSDVATYFTRLKKSWDELSALSNLPTCSCGAAQAFIKHEQDQRLIQFLMGLNQVYDNVRGNILMMRPLPSIGQAYALLVQDEKQRELHTSSHFLSESASMNVSTQLSGNQSSGSQFSGGYRGRNDSKKIICNHCKKPGHPASKCYRLIGFPKDYKFTKGKRMAANVCGEIEDTNGEESYTTKGESSIPGLSQEQCNQLLSLLNKTQIAGKGVAGACSSSNSDPLTASVNFAGPINEEATGTW